MREIKFRAWDESQRYMAYQGSPDLETIQSFMHHFGDKELMQFTGLKDKHGKEIYEGDILSVKEFKSSLFEIIGMPDEEMNEIREGLSLDEIKGELKEEYISDIKWEEGCFVLMSRSDYYDMHIGCLFGDMKYSSPIFEFEIIGNIHENQMKLL